MTEMPQISTWTVARELLLDTGRADAGDAVPAGGASRTV